MRAHKALSLAGSAPPEAELTTNWSMLGAVFGACVGVAAGGMSVVKYASPAWRESQQLEAGWVTVTFRHPEAAVVEDAERWMSEHEDVVSVSRG